LSRAEPILMALCLASWVVALLHLGGFVSLAGSLELSLYGVYSLAAVAGWLAGNVYVRRIAGVPGMPRALARRLLIAYLCGPPAFVFLIRAMAPAREQLAAPFVPLYAFAVYTVLFFVPVTFGRAAARSAGGR
jgi:hypothetical protein